MIFEMSDIRRKLLIACGIGAAFAILLNAWSLERVVTGNLTVSYLNDHLIDERYYFSTIAKVGQGEPAFGHASYLEHRDSAPSTSIAPIVQGLAMRWLHLSLPLTLFLGDVLFPFLAISLLAFGLLFAYRDSVVPAITMSLAIASEIGIYWFRSSNPQMPFVAVMAWLAIAFALPLSERRSIILRALMCGVLLWLHIVYASFFVIIDGVLLLSEAVRRRSWKEFICDGAVYAAVLGLCFLPRFLLHLPADVAEDTSFRLGVIHTHVPALPSTQALLLVCIAILFAWRWKARKWPSEMVQRSTFLLIGAFLALNQAVIHGRDAVFAAYFPHLIHILLLIVVFTILFAVSRWKQWQKIVASIVTASLVIGFCGSVAGQAAASRANAVAYESSDVPAVLAWLRSQPGPVVVAAPSALNERIPYETQDYVLFNGYGWNQPMTDRELAERYALQVRLIPSSRSQETTYTQVFGGAAGLAAAKMRTFCRLKKSLFHASDACDTQARDLIRHQELLPMVDGVVIDVGVAVKTYHVSYVVMAKGEAQEGVRSVCAMVKEIGGYEVWTCGG